MNAISNGMKKREYHYTEYICIQCGEGILAPTKRRRFCDASCRCQFHRDNLKRSKKDIESAQIRAIASVTKLQNAAIEGDSVALSAFRQIEKILDNTAKAIEIENQRKERRNEEARVRLYRKAIESDKGN
jgi:hypothetical protein